MTLTVGLSALLETEFTRAQGLGLAAYKEQDLTQFTLADGVLADQADIQYRSAPGGRTLAASASENLDLSGALTDALGASLVFAKVKAIKIVSDPANTHDIVIGGAASNAFVGPFGAATHTIRLGPGDVWLVTRRDLAGWPVTAGTGDLLKVLNAGAVSPVIYYVNIIGTSV